MGGVLQGPSSGLGMFGDDLVRTLAAVDCLRSGVDMRDP